MRVMWALPLGNPGRKRRGAVPEPHHGTVRGGSGDPEAECKHSVLSLHSLHPALSPVPSK